MHDEDDDDIRRQNYERLFGTTVEREAEAREMAERQRQIDYDSTLARARQRAEARADQGDNITLKSEPTDELGRPLADRSYRLDPGIVTKSFSAPAPKDKRQLDQCDMSLFKAIAAVVVAEEKQRATADAALTDRVAKLEIEVAELRVQALRRTEATTDADARKRAGEIRRAQQHADRLRVA